MCANSWVTIDSDLGDTSISIGARTEMTPTVMLSPNAMNRVFDSLGGTVTWTLNPHVLARARASVALQVTAVVPGANIVPEAGEHSTVTGGAPFTGIGAA